MRAAHRSRCWASARASRRLTWIEPTVRRAFPCGRGTAQLGRQASEKQCVGFVLSASRVAAPPYNGGNLDKELHSHEWTFQEGVRRALRDPPPSAHTSGRRTPAASSFLNRPLTCSTTSTLRRPSPLASPRLTLAAGRVALAVTAGLGRSGEAARENRAFDDEDPPAPRTSAPSTSRAPTSKPASRLSAGPPKPPSATSPRPRVPARARPSRTSAWWGAALMKGRRNAEFARDSEDRAASGPAFARVRALWRPGRGRQRAQMSQDRSDITRRSIDRHGPTNTKFAGDS